MGRRVLLSTADQPKQQFRRRRPSGDDAEVWVDRVSAPGSFSWGSFDVDRRAIAGCSPGPVPRIWITWILFGRSAVVE